MKSPPRAPSPGTPSSRQGPPRQGPPRQGPPRQGPPRQGPPGEAWPGTESPRKGPPGEAWPRTEGPRPNAPHDGTRRNEARGSDARQIDPGFSRARFSASSDPQEATRGRRRALTHVGGHTEIEGDRELGELVRRALDVRGAIDDGGEDETRSHVHGFHSYPAKLHPKTARFLIEELSSVGGRVLDPFCGSGTVLVEARMCGRAAYGTDLNPLAVALARLKVRSFADEEWVRWIEAAKAIADGARARKAAKAGASRRFPPADMEEFDPHVLLELDGLRVGLEAMPMGGAREVLGLVLSSILTKVSKRRGDSSEAHRPLRIAAGYPSRLFEKRTEELVRQLTEARSLYGAAPPSKVCIDDACELVSVPARSISLVVTSPPYPSVYDYVEHHRTRLRWLGLPTEALSRGELGARRHLSSLRPTEARAMFEAQMTSVLQAIGQKLLPDGLAVYVIADGAIGSEALRTDAIMHRAARLAGFEVLAIASQERPHFHDRTQDAFRREPRREHAVVLARASLPSAAFERGRESGPSRSPRAFEQNSGKKRTRQ